MKLKTHCSRGHTKTPENSYGSQCIPCLTSLQTKPAYREYRKRYRQTQAWRDSQAQSKKKARRSERGLRVCRDASWRNRGIPMTSFLYDRKLAQQNGLCQICSEPQSSWTKLLAVDHDHATGKFRGLLCHNCNRALGFLQDNPSIIRRAAQYIENEGDF